MTPAFPLITSYYAAFLGLLSALLTIHVIVNRVKTKVDYGDGGVLSLGQAVRAHGNFTEQAPLLIILIGLVEAFGYRGLIVHGLAAVFTLARLLSAWGLTTSLKQTKGRQLGASLTILVTLAASVLIGWAAMNIR